MLTLETAAGLFSDPLAIAWLTFLPALTPMPGDENPGNFFRVE
jgi:hypothetical protein